MMMAMPIWRRLFALNRRRHGIMEAVNIVATCRHIFDVLYRLCKAGMHCAANPVDGIALATHSINSKGCSPCVILSGADIFKMGRFTFVGVKLHNC